jgi:hypothetical protein
MIEKVALRFESKRNDSFGWFSARVRCSNCHRVSVFIDYECA